MCIICNVGTSEGFYPASEFLDRYKSALSEMEKCAAALLEASGHCAKPEDARRYRRVHKQLVRLRRDWARVEHEREKV